MRQQHLLPRLITLSVPIMLTNLLQVTYNLVDAWFLGRVSAEAVSAPSIAFSIVFFLAVFGMGFSQAGTTLVSQSHGAGRRHSVDFYAAQTVSLVTLTGLVVGVVGALSVEPLLALLRVPTAALHETRIYMRIIFAAVPFMFFFFVLQGVLQGVGDSITALKIQLVTVSLNAVLDPLLIFGVGPIPALGVAGAATATLVSRVLSAVAILMILFRGKEGLRIHKRDLWPRDGAWRKLIAIGVPLATGQGVAALGFTVLQGVVNGFGVAVIAAFGVGNRIIGLFNMPAIGLSRGTAALVGQELGAGRGTEARKVVRLSILAMLAFIVPAMGLTFFFGNEVMRFFVDDPEVIAQGAVLFRVVSVSVIPFTLFTVINGAFQGGGVTRPVMILSILRLWGIRVPLAMFLAWNLALGPVGIWYSMFVSNILTATLGFLLLRRGTWLRRLDLDLAESVA
ncbi:MAG: MATE family efflux transporter [Spirochaetaceae bacterium]